MPRCSPALPSIALGLDTGLLAQLSYASTASLEQAVLEKLAYQSRWRTILRGCRAMGVDVASVDTTRPFRSDLPVEGARTIA